MLHCFGPVALSWYHQEKNFQLNLLHSYTAYQKALSLLYVDELLAAVKAEFVGSHYKLGKHSYPDFGSSFQRLLRDAESRAEAAKRPAVMRSGPPIAAKVRFIVHCASICALIS